ncbi:MAG: aspartate kinase [bacterium]
MTNEIRVQKYGGTSVGSAEKIKKIATKIKKLKDNDPNEKIVIIVSAMGKTTDDLVKLAYICAKTPNPREYDALISTGENISASLLAMCLIEIGIDAISLSGAQAGILTEKSHSKAKVIKVNPKRIHQALDQNKVVIITGFQGINEHEDITTIGRGGSDTSAVIIASSLNSSLCEIYTDVEGVYTTDPRIVKNAKKLSEISYEEMLDLAHLGAKVLHPRAVECAKTNNIKLHVRSSFSDKEGTIVKEASSMELNKTVTGIAVNKTEAIVSIIGVENKAGVAGEIFELLANKNINVDMIIQSVKYGNLNSISFSIEEDDLQKTLKAANTLITKLHAKEIKTDQNIAKISIVGVGMTSKPGVAAQMFKALGKHAINIKHITTSEIKISCVINRDQADEAQKILHETFNLHK